MDLKRKNEVFSNAKLLKRELHLAKKSLQKFLLDHRNNLKWISLIVLVIQNASTIILLRYVRTAPGDMFFSTTAIVCQEFIKMIVATLCIYAESKDLGEFGSTFEQQIWNNKMDSVKTGIPALLYTIQNNLIYLAISNLDAAVFQVTSQVKILTTALFTVILLNRSLKFTQWISLFVLFVGISIIQIQNVKTGGDDAQKNALFGLVCVIMACVLSGLAGVYFEKILKNSKTSIWVRNIQLGLFGTLFALITAFSNDWENIRDKGFFFGYTTLVWINVLVQSAGGLLVAVVIKYADNILKGFATSAAIVLSCIASWYLFNTLIDFMFLFGTMLVVVSVFLYSYSPKSSSSPSSSSASTNSLLPLKSTSASQLPSAQQSQSSPKFVRRENNTNNNLAASQILDEDGYELVKYQPVGRSDIQFTSETNNRPS